MKHLYKLTLLLWVIVSFYYCANGNKGELKLETPKENEIDKVSPPKVSDEPKSVKRVEKKDCSMALRYAKEAEDYSRKVYFASTLQDAKDNANRGKGAFSSASSYANFCDCWNAHSNGSSGESYLRQASGEDDLSDAQSYGRQARSEAESLISKLNQCNEEEKK